MEFFEMPNASYTNRWQQLEKPQTKKKNEV